MISVGIDPGLDGAIAVITDKTALISVVNSFGGELVRINTYGEIVPSAVACDTPTIQTTTNGKRKRLYDLPAIRKIIAPLTSCDDVLAIVEAVHAMPGNGAVSMFSFGYGLGVWHGILSALQIPYTPVSPQSWKAAMLRDKGKDKDSARLEAQRLFPTVDLSLKRDHGRAEALLMAEYGRRMFNGKNR